MGGVGGMGGMGGMGGGMPPGVAEAMSDPEIMLAMQVLLLMADL